MKSTAKVEAYLSELDFALGKIPVSAKAEILVETKKQILEVIEKSPSKNVDTILAEFGRPDRLAQKLLLDRGLQPYTSNRPKILKWLFLGFFGLGFLGVVTIFLAFQFMTPVFDFDEETGQASFFGGLIDLDDIDGNFHVGRIQYADGVASSTHEGSKLIKNSQIEELHIDFSNGRFVIDSGPDGAVSWSCEAKNLTSQRFYYESQTALTFDFQKSAGVDCDLKIPTGLKLSMKGANGKLTLERPNYPVDIDLGNGVVNLSPDQNTNYLYDLSVQNGQLDAFKNSPEDDALKIKVKVANGKIGNVSENN